ncbi:ABC transporter ATP-binding protein [Oscillospiraceae bacterium MB08-C2-2]|nr:ABC transporter ATP-binding protein [Oscillospiraceae bacterium MB08-C2-2]
MSEKKILLEGKDVVKRFGGLTAVNKASMEVREGEIIGLIGPNGAGKTTLFNMFSGSFQPTSGDVIFGGTNITKMKPNQICRLGIGRTFQIVQPFENLTVLENTMVGALINTNSVHEARDKAEEVLEFVGLKERAHSRGSELGLQFLKRMEMARALATEPKLLLLDEVMAGLNPSASVEVIELVQKIRDSGVTVLIIEHIMKAVMTLSDRIYVLSQGSMIAHGIPQDVVKDPEVIKSYLGEKKHA